MDSGAHFHRCDFQVHTPRDRQWNGQGAVTDEERRAYAKDFVAFCRTKGLRAVAITDHHDMAFVQFIRAAAAAEVDANGQPIPAENRLTVFPGMELTLGIPCQALLIFDAGFPEDLFALAMNALAIVASPLTAAQTANTTRLIHIVSLEGVHEELDKHEFLRGRYIVLPNVSEGGASTLLRHGHSGHYQAMPCVGGYLDGGTEQLGDGNQRILSGRDAQYGSKALGLFQTSDCRQRDLGPLGEHSTWVKWAEPTAEALRQACLARQTRLSQVEPLIPATAITALNVSNSVFMGPVYVEFNPQYNALIGGRGTGKSTVLEYVRWALCDQPPQAIDDSANEHVRRRKLVDQTLVPVRGVVDVHFVVNGVPHVVRRSSTNGEVSLRIAGSEFEPCKEADVRVLLPIQAYSQKQLSSVGVRLEELRRFVHGPVRKQLEDIEADLTKTANDIRQAYGGVRAKRLQYREVENDERELRSLTEQTGAIRNALSGIGDADRGILESHPAHERETDIVNAWTRDLDNLERGLDELLQTLKTLPRGQEPDNVAELPQTALLEAMRAALVGAVRQTEKALVAQLEAIRGLRTVGAYAGGAAQWQAQQAAHEANYSAAKARSTAHETKLAELEELEGRSREIRLRLVQGRGGISGLGEPEATLTVSLDQWCGLHERRSDTLAAECGKLTDLSDGRIRATLARGGALNGLAERLKALLAGTSIRTSKVDDLCEGLAKAPSPVRRALQVMQELEQLSQMEADTEGAERLPPTPLLAAANFGAKDLLKLAGKLSPDAWVDVCTTPLEDQPHFEYRLREQEYIAFSDASAGQQATSLLWALLDQEGPPLLIDQPEDDLDNQVLLQIVGQIWVAKQKRQLMFISHNANVVVNGDADLVISCGYRVTGEQAGGLIKTQGAIDVAQVRDEIASVMEGGRAAFTLRKEKYGF